MKRHNSSLHRLGTDAAPPTAVPRSLPRLRAPPAPSSPFHPSLQVQPLQRAAFWLAGMQGPAARCLPNTRERRGIKSPHSPSLAQVLAAHKEPFLAQGLPLVYSPGPDQSKENTPVCASRACTCEPRGERCLFAQDVFSSCPTSPHSTMSCFLLRAAVGSACWKHVGIGKEPN